MKFIGCLTVFLVTFSSLGARAACEREFEEKTSAAVEYLKQACGANWGRDRHCMETDIRNREAQWARELRQSVIMMSQDNRKSQFNYSTDQSKQYASARPGSIDYVSLKKSLEVLCVLNSQQGSIPSGGTSIPATNNTQTANQGNTGNNSPQNCQTNDSRLSSQQAKPQQLQALQQQNQAAQANARSVQQRADADAQRRGRRMHDPAAEAHNCLEVDFTGLFGAMKNNCPYKVHYVFCAYKPRDEKALDSGWLTGLNCENQQFGANEVGPNRASTQHTKGAEAIHYFACKDPAWAMDASFEGREISARCRVVGGN
ncbi:MAG: hypothetical protein HC765_15535 [Brachymonas sp.]|nr:hypothetical protein [Brachymonas sp.]